MLTHNLLLIYRNFKRFKSTFFINLTGLSLGLASVLLIYLWVFDELSFDKYHENDRRLYQVMENLKGEKGIETGAGTANQLSAALAAEFPEVVYASTTTPPNFFPKFTVYGNGDPVKATGKFADKHFFDVFSYSLMEGNKKQVLSDKASMVISEAMAMQLFGTTKNVVGKIIEWEIPGLKKQQQIAGVYKNIPSNSSEFFDFLLPFDEFKDIMGGMKPNWDGAEPFYTYVVLKEGTDNIQFGAKITKFVRSKGNNANRSLFLKPFSDNYLYSKYENGVQTGGRVGYVKLFSTIALFILILACINFINLSTAKASTRIKEVGIKKVLGAERHVLIFQYIGESIFMSALAIMIAIPVVYFLLPQFNIITGKDLTFHLNTDFGLTILTIVLFTGVISGSYPALYLTGFNPVSVLKGKIKNSVSELWIRKGLVVFQFAVSVIFIVSVVVIYKQIEYIQTKNLGYNKDNVISFELEGKTAQNSQTFLSEIKNIPGVLNASSMIGSLTIDGFRSNGVIQWEGKAIESNNMGVNYDLIETAGISLKEGRTFSRDFSANNAQIILNEAAVDAMNIKDPVGKMLRSAGAPDREIIGVVKNFHSQSLHEKIKPLVFRLDPDATNIMIRIKAGMEKETIDRLEAFYKKFNPGFALNYKFLDEEYQALYISEKRVAALSKYFAGLAIVIACLGLFGLAAFTAERRNKEIGIRKVLGSSVFGIVRLLAGDFNKMIFLAICIALPISYLIAVIWLNNFAFKIALEWWYFIAAGLLTIIIALATVSFQSVKAALANPVRSLRTE